MSNIGFTSIIQIHQNSQPQSLAPYPTLSSSETCWMIGAEAPPYGGKSARTSAKYTQGAIIFCHRGT